jgi:cellulose synthase/poly-beta-1,6-N-acetylglucosamine synthase-like glycosyltransferase
MPHSFLLIVPFALIWAVLAVFGAHRSWLVLQHWRNRWRADAERPCPADPPAVLVQLPIFNERYVAPRLLRAVAAFDYPRDRLHIQILDDSTDDTPAVLAPLVARLQAEGLRIDHLRRPDRAGYKAGALEYGLAHSDAPLVAIFDADFVPPRDFLRRAVGGFDHPDVGCVQARWDHLNRDYSLLTRVQATLLDAHFAVEHAARQRGGCFFNFNGTAGVWRREAIVAAGGWQHDTLTEDLDLSYRAQLAGWRFVFLDTLTAPAELPVTVRDFKTQQHRWTMGAIQTARKLLPTVWRAPIPLRCKIEAVFHLLANVCYPLMLAMVLLLGPVCLARAQAPWLGWIWFDLPLLLATTVSIAGFYVRAERLVGRSWGESLAMVPALMAVGVGIGLNNSLAVLEGLGRRGGEFVRTPKFGIQSRRDHWRDKGYVQMRQCLPPWLELGALVYCLTMTVFCVLAGLWSLLPFLGLMLGGFGYVAALTWLGIWCDRSPNACGKLLASTSIDSVS